MVPETTILNFKTLWGNRSILANFKNKIFVGVGLPDFREGQVEKWRQNWKNAQFPSALKGNFYHLSWLERTPIILPFGPQILSMTLKLSQKTPKNYAFEQILKHFLSFEPLPPLISGLNPKFAYATLCVLNRSLVSQIFVLRSYFYQKLSRKNVWGLP